MASKTNTLENEWLLLYFNNSAMAGLGDASGVLPSAAAGSVHCSLHSADPGEAGNQSTSELSYTGYARVAKARSNAQWTVSGNQASNATAITFPQRSDAGAAQEAMFLGIGRDASGAGKLDYRLPIGAAAAPKAFTALADDNVNVPGHSLAVNDKVVAFPTLNAALPTGITAGSQYFVKTVSGDILTLSATQGGATLDITAVGAGILAKLVPLSITQNITPNIAISQAVVQED